MLEEFINLVNYIDPYTKLIKTPKGIKMVKTFKLVKAPIEFFTQLNYMIDLDRAIIEVVKRDVEDIPTVYVTIEL